MPLNPQADLYHHHLFFKKINIMDFNIIWPLLLDNGVSAKKEEGTRRYWQGLTVEQQQAAFTNISTKLRQGRFVHFDPIQAIKENIRAYQLPQPQFLRGDEGEDLVQVKYNGQFKICTRATMELFGLQWVRDW